MNGKLIEFDAGFLSDLNFKKNNLDFYWICRAQNKDNFLVWGNRTKVRSTMLKRENQFNITTRLFVRNKNMDDSIWKIIIE